MSTEYVPLSLKYRPRRFEDLIGQDVIKRTLTNAIKMNRVHHTFLFFGDFGCGKTSAARILAASLNCEKGMTAKPCGECGNCVKIMASQSPDVIELDAASHGGIEQIRSVIEDADYAPVDSRFKIYIIDEVQGLTGKAEEAMLKVLEEPPQSVKFILCTTERYKLKDTVLSRCQDFKIQSLPWSLIASYQKDVCEKEKVQIEVDALKVIAKSADGHLRNAMESLDKVLLYAGNEPITKDMVTKALCTVDDHAYFGLVDAIIDRQFATGMKLVQSLFLRGENVAQILSGLTDHLRTILVIQLCENTSGLIHLGEEDKKRYLQQAQKTNRDLVDEMITLLVNIHRGVFYNNSPQVLFEQFLLKSIKCNHRLQAASGS